MLGKRANACYKGLILFPQSFLPIKENIISKPFPKLQILDCSKLKKFADDNFQFYENGEKVSKRVENTMRKRRNCSLGAMSPFLTVFSKD